MIFQFHNGSIKGCPNAGPAVAPPTEFQFHNGSIKGVISVTGTDAENANFNSTMVRLKDAALAWEVARHEGFQFHNGSIKGTATPRLCHFCATFQFHNGSIKGIQNATTPPSTNPNFNSTMVRLKAEAEFDPTAEVIIFQFHNGSIKGTV